MKQTPREQWVSRLFIIEKNGEMWYNKRAVVNHKNNVQKVREGIRKCIIQNT